MGVCSISPRLNWAYLRYISSVFLNTVCQRNIPHLATAKAFSSFFVIIFCSVLENTRLGTHMLCIRQIIRRTFIFRKIFFFSILVSAVTIGPAFLLLSMCSCWRSSSYCGTSIGSRTFWKRNIANRLQFRRLQGSMIFQLYYLFVWKWKFLPGHENLKLVPKNLSDFINVQNLDQLNLKSFESIDEHKYYY